MRLKMFTPEGSVIIETGEVTQFYPDTASGGELTRIETLNDSVLVKHHFYQVTCALSTAWDMEAKRSAKEPA